MKIGIDLDSVLAEIMDPLIRFHNKRYGKNHTLSDHSTYDLSIVWDIEREEVTRRVYEFYNSVEMDTVLPIRGAIEAVEKLHSKHDLFVITARPYDIVEKTTSWLEKYFPKKFHDIYHTNWVPSKLFKRRNKSDLCIEFGVEVMVEDNIDFANEIASKEIKVFLLPAPWNKVGDIHKNVIRTQGWPEIVEHITKHPTK